MGRILLVLNYYTPYVSGLTNVARDLAESLAKRDWNVIVLCAQHQSDLALQEEINNVSVVRAPVDIRVGKGVISKKFVQLFRKLSNSVDIVNLHAPMLEAGLLAGLSSVPVVMTYQCDVSLSGGVLERFQNKLLDVSSSFAAKKSKLVTVSSSDYASHSRIAQSLLSNHVVIPPTCISRKKGSPKFRDGDGYHIGFLGRIVEEKGVEFLVEGFRNIENPNIRLLIGGDFSNIAGGSVIDRVKAEIGKDHRIKLLGFIPDSELEDFYGSIDLFALPSINPFEAFGIVQVEAMMAGIPVLASNLPGVRQPVLQTGAGVIVAPRSASEIKSGILRAMNFDVDSSCFSKAISLYDFEHTIDKFEAAFIQCMKP